jgi:lysophospholipase L1-like esterase
MRMLASLFAVAVVSVTAYDAALIGRALLRGSELAARSEPFTARPEQPLGTLLIVGDSTGVGTGAADPAESVAGRIGTALPRLRIDNLAVNGALTRELPEQLRQAPLQHYDAVLVQVGGNDILRFTPLAALRDATRETLRRAQGLAPCVVMMSTGDVGTAPAIPWPLSDVYSWRSRRVRELFIAVSGEAGVDYVNLYDPGQDNPFLREPERYYAADGLHPAGPGYGAWFDELRRGSRLLECLSAEPVPDA